MRRILVLAVASAAALTLTPAASAQPEPTFTIRAEVEPGGPILARAGPCETYGAATSPGFTAPIALQEMTGEPGNLVGTGTAVREPGNYTATVQCDARTLTATFTVLPHRPPRWGLHPLEVEPGGEIIVGTDAFGCRGGPEGPVTSPGFAAAINFTEGGNFGRLGGRGRAGTVPGTYTATLRCAGTPIPGRITFRILGTPPNPEPPAQPRPPIVKPKGAPQTGDGTVATWSPARR